MKPRYTPDNIRSLATNEIFVFGSNQHGRHGKGAAKLAKQKFGAIDGRGWGPQGQSYGIPTVVCNQWPESFSGRPMDLESIRLHVGNFLIYARNNPGLTFLVTQIGCGLAGHKVQDIAPMFSGAPDNRVLPEVFHREIFIHRIKNHT